MQVISSVPANGGRIGPSDKIVLQFSKQINKSTVTKGMFYLEQNGKELSFEFSVEGDKIYITPNTNANGRQFLQFTPFDYIAGKQLTAADGTKCFESYYLEFSIQQTASEPVPSGSQPTVPIVNLPEGLQQKITQVKQEYNQFIFTNQFVVRFEKKIANSFNVRLIIERFDGQSTDEYYEVTTASSPVRYVDNALVVTFQQAPVNSVVYLQILSIEFEDGTFGAYEFVQFGRLMPFINAIQLKRQLGSVSQRIRDEDVYYAIFRQMVKLQFAANKQIIGVGELEPQERVFVTEYQKLELIKMLQAPQLTQTGMQLRAGGFEINLGSALQQYTNIDRLQEDLVKQYVLYRPVVQSRSLQYDKSVHSRALRQIELFENYMVRAVVTVSDLGFVVQPGTGYLGLTLNVEI